MPLHLFFAGSAETEDATAIHVIREQIVMSGDTVMTGSFPIFGQPVWDEGLEGNNDWAKTIQRLMDLKPKHIVPGHGPLAHEKDVEILLQIQKYFIEEVTALVKKGFDLKNVLAKVEGRLPRWMTDMPVVWGTPRYAILRVFRGLTKKTADLEPGWQQFKPSAIPAADPAAADKKMHGKETFQEFLQMASEAAEGGDTALRLTILKKASEIFSNSPEALSAYAEGLIEASRAEASVLEKGDFFKEARAAWDKALLLYPNHIGSLLGKGRYGVMMAYRGGDDPRAGMELLRRAVAAIHELPLLNSNTRLQAEAEFYLGMGARRLHDEPAAHAQFRKALALDPAFMPAVLASQA
jgi:tetratricopeptide (TPR) repeat protein